MFKYNCNLFIHYIKLNDIIIKNKYLYLIIAKKNKIYM